MRHAAGHTCLPPPPPFMLLPGGLVGVTDPVLADSGDAPPAASRAARSAARPSSMRSFSRCCQARDEHSRESVLPEPAGGQVGGQRVVRAGLAAR